jgi:curved DNA-binding protein CbpA
MNQCPDPYAVLGVTPAATPAEIAHAFRARLRALHPDTRDAGSGAGSAAGEETQLPQVLAAYALLRDPQRRAAYDQQRPAQSDPAPVRINITHHVDPPAESGRPPLWAGPVRWQR